MNFKEFINESKNNKTIVVIDVQPEVEKWVKFDLVEFGNYLKSFNNVYYIWNGEDLGYCDQNDLEEWLNIKCGVDFDTLDKWDFHPKEYGWFRDMMDSYNFFQEDEIQTIVTYLIQNNLHHSNEIKDFEKLKISKKLIKFLKDIPCYIPDIAEVVQDIPNDVIIIGGASEECLREMLYLFNGFQKSYTLNQKFIYG